MYWLFISDMRTIEVFHLFDCLVLFKIFKPSRSAKRHAVYRAVKNVMVNAARQFSVCRNIGALNTRYLTTFFFMQNDRNFNFITICSVHYYLRPVEENSAVEPTKKLKNSKYQNQLRFQICIVHRSHSPVH